MDRVRAEVPRDARERGQEIRVARGEVRCEERPVGRSVVVALRARHHDEADGDAALGERARVIEGDTLRTAASKRRHHDAHAEPLVEPDIDIVHAHRAHVARARNAPHGLVEWSLPERIA